MDKYISYVTSRPKSGASFEKCIARSPDTLHQIPPQTNPGVQFLVLVARHFAFTSNCEELHEIMRGSCCGSEGLPCDSYRIDRDLHAKR